MMVIKASKIIFLQRSFHAPRCTIPLVSNLPAHPPHQPHHPLAQLALCPPPARLHHPLYQIRRHHQVRASLLLSPRREVPCPAPPATASFPRLLLPATNRSCVPMAKASASSSSGLWHRPTPRAAQQLPPLSLPPSLSLSLSLTASSARLAASHRMSQTTLSLFSLSLFLSPSLSLSHSASSARLGRLAASHRTSIHSLAMSPFLSLSLSLSHTHTHSL